MARAPRRTARAVTIDAVARHAGVSAMTVSNVVNGTKKVRDETRASVMAAVRDLGYIPNAAARALASAQATRIGLVYRNAQNAFLSAMLVGALDAAARLGAQVMLRKCDGVGLDEATAAIAALLRSGANAILLAPPYSELVSGSAFVAELGVPVSAIAYGGPLPDMDSIGIDEAAAARAMTEHLLARGHRRIGYIGGATTHVASRQREEGYYAALAAHGLIAEPTLVVSGDFTFTSGLIAAAALLDLAEPPSAIFAANDDMAAAVSSVAHRRGLDVPRDLAIAGFDDAPIAVKIWPTLTTVRQPIDVMADRATERLIVRQRAGVEAPAPAADRIDHEVIAREST